MQDRWDVKVKNGPIKDKSRLLMGGSVKRI